MDAFLCEGCSEPLTDEMLVDAWEDDEDTSFQDEAYASNLPGACPHCGALQYDHAG